jgi:hypothetical protein
MYEDETDDQAQVEAMSNFAAKGGDFDFAQLGDPTKVPGLLQALYRQQLSAQTEKEASDKKRFEEGTARIKERNQGPTQSEQLFMLSKALLAPRKYTGIGGTIGKISGAFSDISDVERKARQQREAQLAALQDQYMGTTGGYAADRAKTAADLVKVAAPLLKPKTSQQSWSAELQRFVSPDAPAPTQVVVNTKAGLTLTQYTDGTLRLNNPDGSQDVYDPASGKKVGTIPSKGTN